MPVLRWIAQFHEVTATAWFALSAVTVEEADADPVAHTPGGHTGPNGFDLADNLMPRHNRFRRISPHPLYREGIGVADTARLHPQPHLTRVRFPSSPLDQLELPLAGNLECAISGHPAS